MPRESTAHADAHGVLHRQREHEPRVDEWWWGSTDALDLIARRRLRLLTNPSVPGWVRMTAKERIALFFVTHQPRSFCDKCVARVVGVDPSTAYRAAVKVGRAGGFIREYGVCSDCGESRLVTRASR